MEPEPTAGNTTKFMSLPQMFEALMAKLEKIDENVKSLNHKINKMDEENYKQVQAKKLIEQSILFESYMKTIKLGVKYGHKTTDEICELDLLAGDISPKQIEDLFSEVPVPSEFSSFVIIILKELGGYDVWNESYDLSNPIYD